MDDYHPMRGQRVAKIKKERSRELRRAMTDAERVLWERLRGGQLLGLRFRRQQVIQGFIVDFYCHAARLIIEVDGGAHSDSAEYDAERDTALAALGLQTVRFTNDDVVTRMDETLARLNALCAQQPNSPSPV